MDPAGAPGGAGAAPAAAAVHVTAWLPPPTKLTPRALVTSPMGFATVVVLLPAKSSANGCAVPCVTMSEPESPPRAKRTAVDEHLVEVRDGEFFPLAAAPLILDQNVCAPRSNRPTLQTRGQATLPHG